MTPILEIRNLRRWFAIRGAFNRRIGWIRALDDVSLDVMPGEILGLVRKHAYQSHPLNKDKLTIELGDALWCLSMTAHTAGITLDEVAASNVAKLRTRYPDGYSDVASRERRA